jgi:TolA-binding protein
MVRSVFVGIGSITAIIVITWLGLRGFEAVIDARNAPEVPDPIATLQTEIAALRSTLESVNKASDTARKDRASMAQRLDALANQSALTAVQTEVRQLQQEVSTLTGRPITPPDPDTPTIEEVSERLDGLQNQLTVMGGEVQNLSDQQALLVQEINQIAAFEDRLRAVELQRQLMADDIAIMTGRVDQLIAGGTTPNLVGASLLCPARAVDAIIETVSAARLSEMLASCRGQGGNPVNMRILRRDAGCEELNEREACLSIERVSLQRQ